MLELWLPVSIASVELSLCLVSRAGRGVELVEPDFAAARTLNREGLSSCVRDRGLIAALNNRLVNLIETVSRQPSTATPVQSDKQQRLTVFSQRC